jgi:excisionase family DNA binding protein
MPPVFVDAKDLSARLGVSYETLLGWVRRGKIPAVRDGRNRYLFNLNSVLDALRAPPSNGHKSDAPRPREVSP